MTSVKITRNIVLKSLYWKLLERISAQSLSLLIQIFLARILSPADFGSLAIILSIVNFFSLFVQSGLATVLIQKENIDKLDINTIFTSSMYIALVIYLILFIISPYIAAYFKQDSIIWPIRVLSIIIFFNTINAIQSALLSRVMQFKHIFIRSILVIPLSGFIAIYLAYLNYGLWALVFYNLMNSMLTVILFSISSNFRFGFQFDYQRAKQLYSFSINVLFSALLSGISDMLRTIMIGKKYSSFQLAYYDKAYTYSAYFVNIISSVISSVLLPTFSRSQDLIEEVREKARRSVRLCYFFILPFMLGVNIISEPLIRILLTEKWILVVPFLKIFCLLRIPSCIVNIDKQVYLALGNSKIQAKYEFFLITTNLLLLFITIPYGIEVVAYGYLFSEFLGLIVISIISLKIFGYTMQMRIKDLLKPTISSIIMFCVISLPIFDMKTDLLNILFKSLIGLIIYILVSFLLKDSSLSYFYKVILKEMIK